MSSIARMIAKGAPVIGAVDDEAPKEAVRASSFIDVTGVADELLTARIGEEFALPPFERTWIEWRDVPSPFTAAAVIADLVPLEAVPKLDEFSRLIGPIPPERAVGSAGALRCSLLLSGGHIACVGEAFVAMDYLGNTFAVHGENARAMVCSAPLGANRGMCTDDFVSAINVAIGVFSLLNCRNVALKPREDSARRRGRRQGRRGLSWHRLVIVAPGEKRDRSPVVHKGGDELTRAHLARGHFKTFTDDAPLFGKYSGRFWWSPHVRGDKARGVVLKDYELRTA